MSSRVGADAGFKPGSTAHGGATSGTGRGRDDLGSGGTRGGTRDRSSGGLGKGDSDAVDTLDKLLTELCHAGHPRGSKGTNGKARGGAASNPWDRAGWSRKLGKAVGRRDTAVNDPNENESGSSDDEAPGAANHDLLHHHRHHSDHDLEATIVSASTANAAGLYKSSGMGVGGVNGGIGYRARMVSSSAHASGNNYHGNNDWDDVLSRRAGGAVGLSLREHVEAEARNKPTEAFARYMRDLYRRILRLINSPDLRHRLGGVYAIDQLTDAKLGENVGKINRFATYLRDVMTPTCEPHAGGGCVASARAFSVSRRRAHRGHCRHGGEAEHRVALGLGARGSEAVRGGVDLKGARKERADGFQRPRPGVHRRNLAGASRSIAGDSRSSGACLY